MEWPAHPPLEGGGGVSCYTFFFYVIIFYCSFKIFSKYYFFYYFPNCSSNIFWVISYTYKSICCIYIFIIMFCNLFNFSSIFSILLSVLFTAFNISSINISNFLDSILAWTLRGSDI